ncbi:MAG: hypothetical protein J6R37_01190 [Clostridia bacterium]|nr:hypothetical protein [Clostridia bacterium]
MGAKTTCDRFLQGKINENQAFNLAVLCSNASPVYLVATISCAFLQGFATVVLLVAHYLSAMIVCIIFNRKNKGEFTQTVCLKQSQNDYMTDTVFTVLNVGGYVAIFYLICSMICHLFSIDLTNPISAFFLGLLEMTNGANLLSKSLPIPLATPLCCGVVSMGGLCVIFQSLPYLKKCKIKTAPFVMAKITQGAVATILCWIGCKFIAF